METKIAYIKQIKGITFAGKADSNHWVTMDGPENFGGSDSGTRPKELILIALGGCTGSDVVSILQKKRAPLDDFEINISADMTDEHPKVYKNIRLEYVFYGKGIQQKDVERAIELSSTKYCSVTKMLEGSVNITHSYKILEKREDEK
jgi:putative redox protein